MSVLAERLRYAREKRNLKQVQVMELTGINNKTLSGYENEIAEPDFETLKRLADLYEVTIDWLTGKEEKAATSNMNEIDKRFIDEYLKLSDTDKAYFNETMKRIKK